MKKRVLVGWLTCVAVPWVIGGIVMFAVLAICVGSVVQAQSAPEYKPNQVQSLTLQLKQKDATIAYLQAQQAQQAAVNAANDFQAKRKDLNDYAATVKKDNGWPEGVVFNDANLSFAEPPKAAEPPKK